jgi:hypothetical protein
MHRIALSAVALVLLTTAPPTQAGLLHDLEEAAKHGEAAGVKIENKVGGVEAKGATWEANGVKVSPRSGGEGGGGGGDDPPTWFYALLCAVGGGWLFLRFRGKQA